MRDKELIQETTGSKNNVAQSFFQNIILTPRISPSKPFIFNEPIFKTAGGSKDYYGQEPSSVFTNIVKPFIKFDFYENTSSFGPKVKVKHDIYRVNWDSFSIVQSGYQTDLDESIESDDETIETTEEFDEITGETKRKTITKKLTKISNVKGLNKKSLNSNVDRDESTTPTLSDIQYQLDVPIHSITADTKNISSSAYYLEIEQYIKRQGERKTELFQDKCQYIIDTNFIFEVDVTSGLTDFKSLEFDEIVDSVYDNPITAETKSLEHTIEKGQFEGLTIKGGNYFTYFEVPDKPMFEYPTPEGEINTFTPEIFWTNGENADEYVVQVNYDTGDTSFSGTVYSYFVPKTDDFKEVAEGRIKGPSTEFSSEKTIRKFQIPLKTNKSLIYRVGNVKCIRNIFDVKQSVVTFSENKMIYTQSEEMKVLVSTESDSPWVDGVDGYITPPSLGDTIYRTIKGKVKGFSGAAPEAPNMRIEFPNGDYITKSTESDGSYSFTGLTNETQVTLTTSLSGYATDTRTIHISSDLTIDINLQLLWGNDFERWGNFDNIQFKY